MKINKYYYLIVVVKEYNELRGVQDLKQNAFPLLFLLSLSLALPPAEPFWIPEFSFFNSFPDFCFFFDSVTSESDLCIVNIILYNACIHRSKMICNLTYESNFPPPKTPEILSPS
jgi:hypothetical protein